MSQDCDPRYDESFNSFLAGVFLTRSRINNFDLFNLMYSFENAYNVSVVSLGGDICVPIHFIDNEIKLYKDINDVIVINGKNIIIRNYLYSFTTSRVRQYFGIPEIQLQEKKSNGFIKKLFRRDNVKRKLS